MKNPINGEELWKVMTKMESDLLKILKEIRGSSKPEEPYIDGIYWELTIKDVNGHNGIYGDIVSKYTTVVTAETNVTDLANSAALAAISASNSKDAAEEAADSIVSFCRENNYYCHDFYSIDTHDMNDNYWNDATENSVSDKYYNNGGATTNFYKDFQNEHTIGDGYFETRTSPPPAGYILYGDHTDQYMTSNRKAYAMWWILARLAGWDDTPTALEPSHIEKKTEIIYNQVTKELRINGSNDIAGDVRIYNLTGMLCIKKHIDASSLSVAGLQRGLYIVSLNTTEGIVTKKILIR